MNDIHIREAHIGDAHDINRLSEQLGYPLPVAETHQHLEKILANKNEIVYVAETANKVIGWIGVYKILHLVSGFTCEVAGLIIDKNFHRYGAGRLLINKAIEWSSSQQTKNMRVRTNIIRKEAHRFYEKLGFTEVKEQKVYEISV